MVAYSQNGLTANDRSLVVSYSVPGGKLALRRGPTGELLAEAARRWHTEVEPLVWPGNWGYAERNIRGSTTTLSNHASGSAIDLNAPAHPLGTDPRANFTPAKIAAVRRIVADSEGCLRWGGDYTGRKDGMHLEVIAAEARCATVLAKWRGNPSISALKAEEDMTPEQATQLAAIHQKTVAQRLPLAGRPGADTDDPYGHVLSADAAARQALAEVRALAKTVAAIAAALKVKA
jgi:hypothetical protein